MQVITPPIKSLNSRVRALEEELQELKDRTAPKVTQRTPCGSGITEPTSTAPTAATQPCSPVKQPEDLNEPQKGVHHDPRTTQTSYSTVPRRLRLPSSAAADADSTAAAATSSIDSAKSSVVAESCTLAAVACPAVNPPPHFCDGDGRMMQISWRGCSSDAARDYSPHVPRNRTTCALRSNSVAAEADLPTQAGSAVGLMMRTTWQSGTGTASFQEAQWSKKEQSAMAVRLQDLCCSYDAASVMDCQSLRRSQVVSVAAQTASADGTAGNGTDPNVRDAVDFKWNQIGMGRGPVSFGCTVETQRRGQQEDRGDNRVALTSAVPDHGQKLQAVGISVRQIRSSPDSRAVPSTDLSCSAEDESAKHEDSGDRVSTALTQQGVLAFLTFAASSVLWAQPVI